MGRDGREREERMRGEKKQTRGWVRKENRKRRDRGLAKFSA